MTTLQPLIAAVKGAEAGSREFREALAEAIYRGAFFELWGRLPWSAIWNEAAKAPVYAAADEVAALLTALQDQET